MQKNKLLYLIAAIAFDLGSIFAFITHFSGNEGGSTFCVLTEMT